MARYKAAIKLANVAQTGLVIDATEDESGHRQALTGPYDTPPNRYTAAHCR
ncbi:MULTISPECIES: hypothetical protein [unclassified Streptomyces]|uniref:hypothetical protein n=1 Tax=unclassified Streptomyces TaxID=2593676 RepID=UPI00379BB867